MSTSIELYFWPTPNGYKISIALEEMGLPYVIKPVDIGKGAQFSTAFMAIGPNNRMPAIVDPEGPGGAPISVFESGAILQYLGRKSGGFYPKEERARVEVEEWLFWQMANLGPMAGQSGHFLNYAPRLVDDEKQLAYGRARYVNELNRLCGVMEERLSARPFLAGDYSIADMAAFPWARVVHKLGQDFASFPKLKDWINRIREREAVRRGLAAGAELKNRLFQDKESFAEQAKALFGQNAAFIKERALKQG